MDQSILYFLKFCNKPCLPTKNLHWHCIRFLSKHPHRSHIVLLRPRPHVSGNFCIRNFFSDSESFEVQGRSDSVTSLNSKISRYGYRIRRIRVDASRILACVAGVSFPFPNAREGDENCEKLRKINHFSLIFCSPQALARFIARLFDLRLEKERKRLRRLAVFEKKKKRYKNLPGTPVHTYTETFVNFFFEYGFRSHVSGEFDSRIRK